MVAPLLALISLSIIGMADAIYITYEDLSGLVPPCLPLPMFDCAGVLQSSWAHIGPIPLALFGVGFYATVFLAAILSFVMKTPHPWLRYILLALGAWGFLFSALLFYVQGFVIGAFCTFCLLSAATSTGIFAASWWHFVKTKKEARV